LGSLSRSVLVEDASCSFRPGQPGRSCPRIKRSRRDSGVTLNSSPGGRLSTQKIWPAVVSPIARRRRTAAGIFRFTKRSWSLESLFRPSIWKRSPGLQCRKNTERPTAWASRHSHPGIPTGRGSERRVGFKRHSTNRSPSAWMPLDPRVVSTRWDENLPGDSRRMNPPPAFHSRSIPGATVTPCCFRRRSSWSKPTSCPSSQSSWRSTQRCRAGDKDGNGGRSGFPRQAFASSARCSDSSPKSSAVRHSTPRMPGLNSCSRSGSSSCRIRLRRRVRSALEESSRKARP